MQLFFCVLLSLLQNRDPIHLTRSPRVPTFPCWFIQTAWVFILLLLLFRLGTENARILALPLAWSGSGVAFVCCAEPFCFLWFCFARVVDRVTGLLVFLRTEWAARFFLECTTTRVVTWFVTLTLFWSASGWGLFLNLVSIFTLDDKFRMVWAVRNSGSCAAYEDNRSANSAWTERYIQRDAYKKQRVTVVNDSWHDNSMHLPDKKETQTYTYQLWETIFVVLWVQGLPSLKVWQPKLGIWILERNVLSDTVTVFQLDCFENPNTLSALLGCCSRAYFCYNDPTILLKWPYFC